MGYDYEIIGNRKVVPMGDGKYAVSVTTPNHCGACLMDEEAVQKLREKYGAGEDKLDISSQTLTAKEPEEKSLWQSIKDFFVKRDEEVYEGQKEFINKMGGPMVVLSNQLNYFLNPALVLAAQRMIQEQAEQQKQAA